MGRAKLDILRTVGRLHEGIADSHAWTGAIREVCDGLGIPRLLLGRADGGGRAVGFEFAHKIGQNLISLVEGPLNDPDHNPWLSLARAHPLRQVATIGDVGGREAFAQTRIWSEVHRPYVRADTLGSTLERQPEYSEVLIAARQTCQPDFTAGDRRTLAAIVPHLARALRVKRMLDEWEALNGTLKFVLDRLDRAIIVAGPEGQVRFANRAADRLLTRGDGIDVTSGRVRAASARDTNALRDLVGMAARTGVGAGQVAVDAMSVRRGDDYRRAARSGA